MLDLYLYIGLLYGKNILSIHPSIHPSIIHTVKRNDESEIKPKNKTQHKHTRNIYTKKILIKRIWSGSRERGYCYGLF